MYYSIAPIRACKLGEQDTMHLTGLCIQRGQALKFFTLPESGLKRFSALFHAASRGVAHVTNLKCAYQQFVTEHYAFKVRPWLLQ